MGALNLAWEPGWEQPISSNWVSLLTAQALVSRVLKRDCPLSNSFLQPIPSISQANIIPYQKCPVFPNRCRNHIHPFLSAALVAVCSQSRRVKSISLCLHPDENAGIRRMLDMSG